VRTRPSDSNKGQRCTITLLPRPTRVVRGACIRSNWNLYRAGCVTRRPLNGYLIDLGKIYPRSISEPPFGMGFVSLVFDPNYAKSGRFYTVHTEKASMSGSREPERAALPGLDLKGFKTTAAINPPAGEVAYECIVTEWTDTNINNATFEGRSREVLRAGTNFLIHPMGDMIFNPLAKPGSPDYGNLYIGIGDGAAGERAGPTHNLPQRLDVANADPYGDGARYGGGRADVRLALGGDGELYLLCKTDGWIRKLVAVTPPPNFENGHAVTVHPKLESPKFLRPAGSNEYCICIGSNCVVPFTPLEMHSTRTLPSTHIAPV